MIVYLVPVGRDQYELYSEAPEDSEPSSRADGGFFSRHAARFRGRWHAAVDAARRAEPSTRWLARVRDRLVSQIVETVAEQRTLWALGREDAAAAAYPSNLDAATAHAIVSAALAAARRHHLRWLIVDASVFVLSGLLVLVPGPNLVAYYFAFRLVGHYLSWRGARRGLMRTQWSAHPEPALAELGRLADLPREARTAEVEAIAHRLNLPKLAAFFNRAAIPAA